MNFNIWNITFQSTRVSKTVKGVNACMRLPDYLGSVLWIQPTVEMQSMACMQQVLSSDTNMLLVGRSVQVHITLLELPRWAWGITRFHLQFQLDGGKTYAPLRSMGRYQTQASKWGKHKVLFQSYFFSINCAAEHTPEIFTVESYHEKNAWISRYTNAGFTQFSSY